MVRVAFLITEPLYSSERGACDEYFTGLVYCTGEFGFVFGCGKVIPAGNVACCRPLQAFLMLARDIMSRLNRKMVG